MPTLDIPFYMDLAAEQLKHELSQDIIDLKDHELLEAICVRVMTAGLRGSGVDVAEGWDEIHH